MRLPKSERHWQYWCKIGNLPHNAFIRHMRAWERFYGVWPRGFQFNFEGADKSRLYGVAGQLSFEKTRKLT